MRGSSAASETPKRTRRISQAQITKDKKNGIVTPRPGASPGGSAQPEPESDTSNVVYDWSGLLGFIFAMTKGDEPPVRVGPLRGEILKREAAAASEADAETLEEDFNPLLHDSDEEEEKKKEAAKVFVPDEVLYRHKWKAPEPDSDDSDDDEPPTDPGPQVAFKQAPNGVVVFKFGPQAKKLGKGGNGMEVGLLLIKINDDSVANFSMAFVREALNQLKTHTTKLQFITQKKEVVVVESSSEEDGSSSEESGSSEEED